MQLTVSFEIKLTVLFRHPITPVIELNDYVNVIIFYSAGRTERPLRKSRQFCRNEVSSS